MLMEFQRSRWWDAQQGKGYVSLCGDIRPEDKLWQCMREDDAPRSGCAA